MLLSHRRRRAYGMRGLPEERRGRWIRIILLLIAIWAVYAVVSRFLKMLGVGNPTERAAAMATVERGSVSVSIDGASPQRAENGMKLYPGDRLVTGPGSRAVLSLFDGTFIRMDENADMALRESEKGREVSTITLELTTGRVWASVPQKKSFSGTMLRTIETPAFTYTLPQRTDALISPFSLGVFTAEGLGVGVHAKNGRSEDASIGEGQQWNVTSENAVDANLYTYRTPITAELNELPFVTESRVSISTLRAKQNAEAALAGSGIVLVVTSPSQGASVPTGSFPITGKVGTIVASVFINGRQVSIEPTTRSFSEVFRPDTLGDVSIEIQAMGSDGALLASEKRIVHQEAAVLAPPSVESPMKTGETYRTQEEEFVLRGTAPKGATGIMVNDYTLKLFDAEKGTWSYLAATRLGNLKQGKNDFLVVALYGESPSQEKSPASTVTVLLEEGTPGVVSTSSSSTGTTGSSVSSIAPQNNAPLTPGVLKILAPAETVLRGTGALLEGETSAQTDSIWVNDYRLQLYKAGKTTWNYIMSPDLKNVKEGENEFVITARNAKGEVLDKLTHKVTYQQ